MTGRTVARVDATIEHALKQLVGDTRQLVGRTLDQLAARRSSQRFSALVADAAPSAHVAFGVGRTPLEGWISTDITRDVGLYLDLTKPWPVPVGAVSHAYGDNVIEHFTLERGRDVLRHCHDALAAGGRLRLSTPDLERAARAYLDQSDLGREHLAVYRDTDVVSEHPVDLVRMLFAYNDHWAGYLYDEPTLTMELRDAGFKTIDRCEPGESDDPVLRGLEKRTGDSFQHFQLVLEATKPS
jgi:predicted SAM-dependent methyltransferase